MYTCPHSPKDMLEDVLYYSSKPPPTRMNHTALILRLLQTVTPPITAVSSIISSPRRAYPSPRASAKGQSNSNELNNLAPDDSLLGELSSGNRTNPHTRFREKPVS